MRLRVTLLHDGTNADVEAALTALWRAIPPEDVDVHLVTIDDASVVPAWRTLKALRSISDFLSRDRCDVIHAWLARPALICGLLRQLPDRPALITGVPGTARRMESSALASAAHITAGFLADMVTTWHPDTARWLVEAGLPSSAVAVVPRPGEDTDDPATLRRAAAHNVRLYDEAVARNLPTWRRFVRLPRL